MALVSREHNLDVWEQRTGRPLSIAAMAFLVVYALPILQPEMPQSGEDSSCCRCSDPFERSACSPSVVG